MIYQSLAKYYDDLFKDEEAFKRWEKFVRDHFNGKTVLELASGSGELANLLSEDYDVTASDISDEMLEILHQKFPYLKYQKLDMRDFKAEADCILCFCDSINYLYDLDEVEAMFKCISNSLKSGGKFLFDIHSINRVDEFKDGYMEEGYLDDVPYIWSIDLDEDKLIHNFIFYAKEGVIKEQHLQTIFKLDDILAIMNSLNFKYEVYTDFDKVGIQEGEKYFVIGEKI